MVVGRLKIVFKTVRTLMIITACSGRVRRRSDTVCVRPGNRFTYGAVRPRGKQDQVRRKAVGSTSRRGPHGARSNRLDGNGAEAAYDEQRQFGQHLGDNGGHEWIGQHHDGGIPHCRLK